MFDNSKTRSRLLHSPWDASLEVLDLDVHRFEFLFKKTGGFPRIYLGPARENIYSRIAVFRP
jgi:hypothetical protein